MAGSRRPSGHRYLSRSAKCSVRHRVHARRGTTEGGCSLDGQTAPSASLNRRLGCRALRPRGLGASVEARGFKPMPPTESTPDTLLAPAPILVADDDPDDLFFAVRLLRKTGTSNPVITFDDGTGVVDYLSRAWLTPPADRSLLPRLLFLDLKMTGLGGFAFLEWLQDHRARAPLNVVVLSGSDEPEDVERAKKLGAKRYLAKYPTVATFRTIVLDAYPNHAASSVQTSQPFFLSGLPKRLTRPGIAELHRRE